MKSTAIVALVCVILAAAAVISHGAPIGDEEIDYRRLGPNGAGGRGLKLLFFLSKLFGQEPNGFSISGALGLGVIYDEIETDVEFGPVRFTLDPAESSAENGEERKKAK
ncbi:hypothetical protein BSKO_08934 [Bryopsis sp. KO-2023]|nr:hypothetical protein BSKO_08934 [Bryopsis sp. KO-2023]